MHLILFILALMAVRPLYAQLSTNIPPKAFGMDATLSKDTPDLPLFPVEEKIANFPAALPEEDRKPENLEIYYNEVAATYEMMAEENEKTAAHALNQANRTRHEMGVNAMRGYQEFGAVESDPMARARMHSVAYTGQEVGPAQSKAMEARQKAQFYRAMAEASKEQTAVKPSGQPQ